MSEERMYPPDVAAKLRQRLREIRLTKPHWNGGKVDKQQAREHEQKLEANLGQIIGRLLEHEGDVTTISTIRCRFCGAAEELVGRRMLITHDFDKHPKGGIPASQLDVKPMQRSRERDEESIFGKQDYAAGDRRRPLEVSY